LPAGSHALVVPRQPACIFASGHGGGRRLGALAPALGGPSPGRCGRRARRPAQAARRVHEMSRRVRVGLGTVISAVVLAALLWFTDPAQIWDTLSAADMRWIAAATLVNIATVPVMAWRWQLLLRAKAIAVPMGWLIRT